MLGQVIGMPPDLLMWLALEPQKLALLAEHGSPCPKRLQLHGMKHAKGWLSSHRTNPNRRVLDVPFFTNQSERSWGTETWLGTCTHPTSRKAIVLTGFFKKQTIPDPGAQFADSKDSERNVLPKKTVKKTG